MGAATQILRSFVWIKNYACGGGKEVKIRNLNQSPPRMNDHPPFPVYSTKKWRHRRQNWWLRASTAIERKTIRPSVQLLRFILPHSNRSSNSPQKLRIVLIRDTTGIEGASTSRNHSNMTASGLWLRWRWRRTDVTRRGTTKFWKIFTFRN